MRAAVFYNRQTDERGRLVGMLDGYVPGQKLELVVDLNVQSPAERGAVSHGADEDAQDVAHQVFEMLNRGSGRESPILDEAELRSMSVGDVVIVRPVGEKLREGRAFSCENVGWKPRLTGRVLFDAGLYMEEIVRGGDA